MTKLKVTETLGPDPNEAITTKGAAIEPEPRARPMIAPVLLFIVNPAGKDEQEKLIGPPKREGMMSLATVLARMM